jgi:hypothetical protein
MVPVAENELSFFFFVYLQDLRGCIQKFPDWPPGARTSNGKLSATRCSCIAILWVSLVSFAAIILYFGSQRLFIVVSVYFVIYLVRKLLDTLSYTSGPSLQEHSFCKITLPVTEHMGRIRYYADRYIWDIYLSLISAFELASWNEGLEAKGGGEG